MTQKQGKPAVVHVDIRKLKRKPETNLPSLSKARLSPKPGSTLVK